jgi:tRNA (guanine37-N1)-methyltransferase
MKLGIFEIEKWQEDKAFEHTKNRRPDLLEENNL